MIKKYKKYLIAIAFLITTYTILPNLWPEPEINVRFPSEARLNQDTQILLTVDAWHSNLSLFEADALFHVDPQLNQGNGIIVTNLINSKKNVPWDANHTLDISHWTWPRRVEIPLTLPLATLSEKKPLNPGIQKVGIRIKLSYPQVTLQGSVITKRVSLIKSFDLKLVKSNL